MTTTSTLGTLDVLSADRVTFHDPGNVSVSRVTRELKLNSLAEILHQTAPDGVFEGLCASWSSGASSHQCLGYTVNL